MKTRSSNNNFTWCAKQVSRKKYNNEAPVKLEQIVDNDRVGDSVLCTVMIFKAS